MKHKNLFLSFVVISILILFVGCSDFFGGNITTDLKFKINLSELQLNSRSVANSNEVAKISVELTSQDNSVSLKQEQIIIDYASDYFTFKNIRIGSTIKITAKIYQDDKEIYFGETEWLIIKKYNNLISLILEKIVDESENPETPVDPEKPSDPNQPETPETGVVTLSFNSNGGTAVENISGNVGATVTAPTNPTKTGYTFVGWNPELPTTFPAENASFTANWTPNTYTVTFNANGGTGEMDSQSFTYDVEQELSANTFTRTDYTFAGWSTTSGTSSVQFNDKQSVKNLTTVANGNVTLYAQWIEKGAYKITYELNGGENNSQNLNSYKDSSGEITLYTPTRTGYTFVGWYTEANFTTKISTISADSTGDITLYAKWEAITYSLTYELDNGSFDTTTPPSTYNIETQTIILPSPSKVGYTFIGWYTEASFTTKISEIPTGSTGNKQLYAQWTPISYTVTFNENGGSGSMDSLSFTYDKAQTLTANSFTKTGYTFAGWNTNANGSGTSYANSASVKNLTTTANGTVTLYAQWSVNTYTITYNLNEGTNSTSNPSTYTVETPTITFEAPTRDGYNFVGWFTDANFGTAITTITKGSTGDKTLHAKWEEAITYAQGITYDSTSNTLYISNEEGLITFRDIVNETLAAPVTIKDTSPSNNDITFDYTDYTGYDNSARTLNAKLTNDITLTKDWTPIGHSSIYSYAGTFDGDGHTISNLNINETTSSYSTGFIGYSGYSSTGGIIQNLVISGTMNVNSDAAGGFVGTSAYGCTITNCVNQINITNTSEADYTGTAGFVGLLDYDYEVSISNSINLGNITGTNNVAGFVGSFSENSYKQSVYNIDKSINIGKIIASEAAKTAAGFSAINASSSKSLTNLINMGTLGNNDVAGICYFSIGTTMTISNCINTGKSDITSGTYNAIIPLDNKPTSNCYFDNSINPNITYGGTGKTTDELCTLTQNDLSDNWTFADGRYPLPNIGSSIPGGEEGNIWQAVIAAATPTDIGGGTGGGATALDGTVVNSEAELTAAIADTSVDTIIIASDISLTTGFTIDRDITIAANNDFTITQNTSSYLFDVSSDKTFTLGGGAGVLTIEGASGYTNNTIYSNGNIILKDNIALTNSYASSGVIYLYKGTLTMEGGSIYNNNSNAITSNMGGGDVEINISGGEIYSNTKNNTSYGSAIYIMSSNYYKATVNIYGNTKIYNNINTSGSAISIRDSNSDLKINSTEEENNASIYNNTSSNINMYLGNLYIDKQQITENIEPYTPNINYP